MVTSMEMGTTAILMETMGTHTVLRSNQRKTRSEKASLVMITMTKAQFCKRKIKNMGIHMMTRIMDIAMTRRQKTMDTAMTRRQRRK